MLKIFNITQLNTQNEHVLEHDLKNKTQFSLPKIYTANGDISKRWYVYFSFRNPETGKMKRLSNIYGQANNFKTKEARFSVLTIYRKRLIYLLKQGYNPFEDNTELYQRLKQKQESKLVIPNPSPVKENIVLKKEKKVTDDKQELEQIIRDLKDVIDNVKGKSEELNSVSETTSLISQNNKLTNNKTVIKKVESKMPFSEAFDFAFKLKEKEVSISTISDYRGKVKKLLNWLAENREDKKCIEELKRKDILDFLNAILIKTSARTRNNYRADLGSLFQVLKNNEIVDENYLKTIRVLKSKPEKHKRYTLQLQEEIFKYLEVEDPILLLYIKFIYYGFLRPIEVSRLRIKDINKKNKMLQFQSKTKKLKTKRIPDILLKEIPDISKIDKNDFLFTPDKIGGPWSANEVNRRDHFTKRFGKIVKNQFELNENYGLYSFRHTAITRLYNQLKKDTTEYEAKSKLMPITGHITMIALEKYLRDIDADLPEDYSDLFSVDSQ